jgi:hypothetical protein
MHHTEVQMDDREQRARQAVRRARKNLPWMFSKEGNLRWYRHHLANQDATFLVAAAREGDADAIELLREYAKRARAAGVTVPPDLHEFVWEYFIDGKPPANRAGTSAKQTELRNQAIAVVVGMVATDYGFPVYANAEYRGTDGPMTACRIVGEEFGLDMQTVEAIYGERKASLDRAHKARTSPLRRSRKIARRILPYDKPMKSA